MTLPYANNSPTCLPQQASYTPVPHLIAIDLLEPVLDIRRGKTVACGTPVPETSINEECDLEFRPTKIWSSDNWEMPAPALQAGSSQNLHQFQFRGLVPLGFHGRHRTGSGFLVHVVQSRLSISLASVSLSLLY